MRASGAYTKNLSTKGLGVIMAKLPRRKCANKECRQWFNPVRDTQTVCGYECASAVGKEQTRKAALDVLWRWVLSRAFKDQREAENAASQLMSFAG